MTDPPRLIPKDRLRVDEASVGGAKRLPARVRRANKVVDKILLELRLDTGPQLTTHSRRGSSASTEDPRNTR